MNVTIPSLIQRFQGHIRVLLVDDDEKLLNTLSDMLDSPVLDITTASSSQEARKIIQKQKGRVPWHCWVLDIAMEHENSGIKMIEEFSTFPFVIILSGLGSMSIASQAIQAGAMRVIDKNPSLLDEVSEEVAKIGAMGYLLNGTGSQYLHIFNLLHKKMYRHAYEWADDACVSTRQLQRICQLHNKWATKENLTLYYILSFLAGRSKEEAIAFFDDGEDLRKRPEREFMRFCLERAEVLP